MVEDFTQPNEVEGGVFSVDIKFIQFENSKPTGGKPTQSSAMNVYEGKTGISDDPIDVMIDDMSSEVENLEAETS